MTFPEIKLLLVVPFAVAILFGCASTPHEEQAAAGGPVCKRTYPLGSNIPTTTCISAEQAAEEKRDNDAFRLRAPAPARLSTGGAGG